MKSNHQIWKSNIAFLKKINSCVLLWQFYVDEKKREVQVNRNNLHNNHVLCKVSLMKRWSDLPQLIWRIMPYLILITTKAQPLYWSQIITCWHYVFMSFRTNVRNLYHCATRFLPLVEMTATCKTLIVPLLSFSGNQVSDSNNYDWFIQISQVVIKVKGFSYVQILLFKNRVHNQDKSCSSGRSYNHKRDRLYSLRMYQKPHPHSYYRVPQDRCFVHVL